MNYCLLCFANKTKFYNFVKNIIMGTKEKIKKEIDKLSEEFLDDVLKYLYNLKNTYKPKKNIRRLHLKGQFDNINIRQNAYE